MSEKTRIRVLLVEDSVDDAELVLMALRRGGYDVVHERVETEEAMRAALERGTWDIVLSDYSMPRFSGPAALELLVGMGLELPFIIVSGTVGEEAAVAAMRSGAHDYVLKGNLARLCPTIERELRDANDRLEKKKMQEQLLISERMASVGTLAAGVAHEINNPLAAVIANLDLMTGDLGKVAEQLDIRNDLRDVFEELQDARESADRLRQIVRDLKIFSRSPDEEKQGPVSVTRILDSSIRMAWTEIRHRARLVKNYGTVPPVQANDARLGQVFLNLIVNAAHAIREGDAENNTIVVATELDPSGRVAVEVRDTGCGIAPETLPRIFDAFFTTKPIGIGTGLGLSICHRIVSSMGGSIRVDSQVSKGTSFRVLLPVARDEEEAIAPAATPRPGARRGRVLVVDDEPMLAKSIAGLLRREHEVIVATSASEALQRIGRGELFDVVLCDLMMPQMTGMELHAELLRASPEHVPRMIFLTGGAFTPRARAFLDEVDNQRIEKPFDPQHLRSLINDRLK